VCTPERAGSLIFLELPMHVSTGPLRSVPGYAFPFSELPQRTQKRARLQPVGCVFMLTPDVWNCCPLGSVRHLRRAFFGFKFFLLPRVPAAQCRQALSTPAHTQVPRRELAGLTQAVETAEKVPFQNLFLKSGREMLINTWFLVFHTMF